MLAIFSQIHYIISVVLRLNYTNILILVTVGFGLICVFPIKRGTTAQSSHLFIYGSSKGNHHNRVLETQAGRNLPSCKCATALQGKDLPMSTHQPKSIFKRENGGTGYGLAVACLCQLYIAPEHITVQSSQSYKMLKEDRSI